MSLATKQFSRQMWVAVAFLCAVPAGTRAQPCALDSSFSSGLASGAIIYALAMQTNGQMLVGGIFQSINGEDRFNVARLNHNGSVDGSFDAGTVADIGYVSALAVQGDGKVLLGGSFGSSSGAAAPYLTRLHTNGTVDSSFNQNLRLDGPVSSIILQPDGKIVIAGSFGAVDNFSRQLIARLHSNGTLDTNFDACVASSDGATALVLLGDGKFLMTGGSFSFSSGVFRNGIARLESNGNVDPTYAAGPGIDAGTAYTLVVRSNGHVILGGDFSAYDYTARNGLVELDAEGAVDTTFDPGTGVKPGQAVFTTLLQDGGRLLIGGSFTSFNGVSSGGIARLRVDGSLDDACDPGFGANNTVSSLLMQTDGKVMLGGLFDAFDDVEGSALARIKGDPPPVRLGLPSRLPGGTFQIMFYGESTLRYALEASSNLVDWISITNFTAGDQPTPVIDPDSNVRPVRFYRAKSLP